MKGGLVSNIRFFLHCRFHFSAIIRKFAEYRRLVLAQGVDYLCENKFKILIINNLTIKL